MAKAKNQGELAERFVRGDREGTVTTLSIINDVIFNTEDGKHGFDKCKPIAIRLTEKVALINAMSPGGQFSYQRRLVRTALQNYGWSVQETYIATVPDPKQQVKVDEGDLQELIRAAKEAGAERQLKALTAFLQDRKEATKKANLEVLVQLPEILDQAVREKHISDEKMDEILRAREEVKRLIDEVDKYLGVIMALPSATGAPVSSSEEIPESFKAGVQAIEEVNKSAQADITLPGQQDSSSLT